MHADALYLETWNLLAIQIPCAISFEGCFKGLDSAKLAFIFAALPSF